MAVKLTEIRAEVRTVTATWGGDEFDVGYRPGEFTPARAAAISDVDESDVGKFASLIVPLIAWWDVLDDDGERLPVTEDTIASLPVAFLMNVIRAIGENLRPPVSRG